MMMKAYKKLFETTDWSNIELLTLVDAPGGIARLQNVLELAREKRSANFYMDIAPIKSKATIRFVNQYGVFFKGEAKYKEPWATGSRLECERFCARVNYLLGLPGQT